MTRDPTLKSSAQQAAEAEAAAKKRRKSKKTLERDKKNRDRFFWKYADKQSGIIEPSGIEALCSDLNVDHTDYRILKLAWKMGAEKQGYFTLEEWKRGLEPLEVTCATKLKKALRALKNEEMEPDEIKDFYEFAYRFNLIEEEERLDIETTCTLLEMVLGPIHSDEVDSLVEFLKMTKIQTAYTTISMDQWMSFLHFFRETNFPDFDNYSTSEAWPLILDYFVEWMKAKQEQEQANPEHGDDEI